MKKLKTLALTLLTVMTALSLSGQTIIDLRLNEVMLNNNKFEDEYGNTPAWIEIFNTSYNSVNIGGCFLTSDTTGLTDAKSGDKEKLNQFKEKCYHIPAGDPATLMPQRSCLVFYMDNLPTYGTFHTNFRGENIKYIALIGSDGKTLIDLMVIPAKQLSQLQSQCVSYGCEKDGVVALNRDNSVLAKKNNADQRTLLKNFTPASNNEVLSGEGKADKLAKNDPWGWQMALMSMAIVFTVLTIIFLVLKVFGWYAKREAEKKNQPKEAPKAKAAAKAAGAPTDEEIAAISLALSKSCVSAEDEEIAAISLALYLYLDTQHDQESEVITFGQAESHWGQKQFNFKQDPR